MVQQTGASGVALLPSTFTAAAQYLISTTVPGSANRIAAVSTPSTPTAQQPLAFSTLNVCVATPPIPQLFINTQAAAPVVQPLALLSYQPQVMAQSPLAPQYRPLASTPVQGMTYAQLQLTATPPSSTLRTPTVPQTYSQVWRR